MPSPVEELLKFLQLGARFDLKALALEHVLGLTGTESGLGPLLDNSALLVSLLALLNDANAPIAKDSALCLVNISADEKGSQKLVELKIEDSCPPLTKPPQNVVATCLRFIFNVDSSLADPCCMILSNLSRPQMLTEKVIDLIEQSAHSFEEIIEVFTKKNYNKKGANLNYLGPFLSNLSQSSSVRKYILNKEKCIIQRLLPFTEFQDSLVRRGGIIGTLKNLCFEEAYHEWLLSDEVDILPRLLLPLAGNEEFDEEDNDKLPLDLQYLPEDKKREEDPDIRNMLIEAITQLCALKKNREFIRDKNTYVILRELHKYEKDRKVLLACENLVDILIRTEEEIGEDNLKEVVVPDHLKEVFVKVDEEYLKEN